MKQYNKNDQNQKQMSINFSPNSSIKSIKFLNVDVDTERDKQKPISIINHPIEEKKQLYSWLNVKSNYDALNVRLKKILIQNINQLQNQQLITYYFNRLKGQQYNIDSQKQKHISQKNKLTLHFSKQNMSKLFHNKTDWKIEDQQKFNQLLKYQKKEYAKGLPPKRCSQKRYLRNRTMSPKSFTSLALKNCVKQIQNQISYRPHLLEKYCNNEILTEEENKILVRTNPLLNKCFDKQFIKKAVYNIDKQTIYNMELQIADQVIKNWYDKLKQLKQQRTKLIKKNNIKKIKCLKEIQSKNQQKIIIQEMKQLNKIYKKILKHQIKQIVKTNSKRVLNPEPKGTPIHHWPYSDNKFHPSTPLYITENQQHQETLTKSQNKFLKHINQRVEQQLQYRNNCQFKNFYSGGPTKEKSNTQQINSKKIQKICKKFRAKAELQRLIQVKKLGSSNINKEQFFKNELQSKNLKQLEYKKQKQQDQTSQYNTKYDYIQNDQKQKKKQKKTVAQKSINRKIFIAIKKKNLLELRSLLSTITQKQINCFNQHMKTPLYMAAFYQSFQLCSQLLNFGAKPNIKCINGQTAVHIAFQSNYIDLIRQFIHHNGDLNILDDQGTTPLGYATVNTLKKLNLNNGVIKATFKDKFDNNKLYFNPELSKVVDQDILVYQKK